jgi:hypothetical protein
MMQVEPGRHASYRRYCKVPQALRGKLMHSDSSDLNLVAGASILYVSNISLMYSRQPGQGQQQGFLAQVQAQDSEQVAQFELDPFLRAQSDPLATILWSAEVFGKGENEFMRTVSSDGVMDTESGTDTKMMLSLLEAYTWQTTETSAKLQSMLYQVDWAMKSCSSASVMFTRFEPFSYTYLPIGIKYVHIPPGNN